ncbi:MAG: hypothetical protein JXA90_04055, partial [Planctomycetes bacterium]|nr:hypothetical protein [Planctomycetota bacterium]
MTKATALLLSVGFLLAAASAASGQCVYVISTGYDRAAEAVLAEGEIDLDYTITDGLGVTYEAYTGGAGHGFPIPPWIANDPDSLWISPSVNANAPPGDYTYEIVFELDDSIVDPSEMVLLGTIAGDDSGLDIVINGVSTGAVFGGFDTFKDIPRGTGFGLLQEGENTVQFIVQNGGPADNPAGLRIDGCVAVGTAGFRRFDISTGFDQGSLRLVDGGENDDDYTVSGPLGDDLPAVAVADLPIPTWVANTIQSRWIGTSNPDSSGPAGDYIYKIEIDLPGDFSAEDGVLLGSFTADDLVTDVLVNSQSTGIGGGGFTGLNKFPLNAGRGLFVTGTNTIELVVQNGEEGPTGLRVDAEIAEGPPEVEGLPSLFSLDTGFDNETGMTIANSSPDDNYVIYGPAGSGIADLATIVPDTAFPIDPATGPWLASSAQSKWIGTSEVSSNGPAGVYSFQIIVRVPVGTDAASLRLIGGWSTDNAGLDVLINGVSTGLSTGGNFTVLQPFPEGAGLGLFQSGDNTVEFLVDNAAPDGNPVGLRVEAIVGTGVVDPTDLSTGVAPRGIGLLAGGEEDPRFTVTGPAGSGIGPRPAVATPADGNPIPPWIANSTASRWIGLDDGDSIGPAGTYHYDLTFDLPPEFNAYRAVLSGSWAAAGRGADVLLNGVSLEIAASGPDSLTTIPDGTGEGLFLPGTNALRFVVENSSAGSTGLRVEARLEILARASPLDISTGFDDASGAAIDEGVVDDDYAVTDPLFVTEDAVVVPDVATAVPTWLKNSSSSRWIGLPGAIAATPGEYRYQTAVNLTADQAAVASIVGFWAVDDSSVDLLINSVSTGL